jgi:hypothetical protein
LARQTLDSIFAATLSKPFSSILFKGAATGEMGVRLWDVLKKQPDATVSYKKSHYWTYRYGRDCTNEIDLIKKMDFIKQIRLL